MTSGTVPVLLFLLRAAYAQQQSQFNQVLNLNGDMAINSFVFPDNSKVETFSQSQRQLIVNQNTNPLDPNSVTGTSGQPFVALSPQSLSISTNGANDLVGGQIEMSIGQNTLQQAQVNPDNTFVAQLSPDRQSWMIMETMRSVNVTDNTVRMTKRTNIDGEYMVLGRQTVETNNALVPFGNNQQNAQTIQGTGLQEMEFVDGFRMSVRARQPMTVTTDVKNGVSSGMTAALQGMQPVNNFRYLVTTSLAGVQPNLNQMQTVVQLPLNAVRVQQMAQQMTGGGQDPNAQLAVGIAQRPVQSNPGGAQGAVPAPGAAGAAGAGAAGAGAAGVGAAGAAGPRKRQNTAQTGNIPTTGNTPQTGNNNGGTGTLGNNPAATQLLLAPTFTPVQAQAVLDPLNGRVAIPVMQVDGEFIITMQKMGGATGAQPAAQAPQGAQPQAGAQPAQGQQPQAAQPAQGARPANGTAGAEPRPAGEAPKFMVRQSNQPTAPKGSVIMTMKEIDRMAESARNGGYIAVSKMMDDYKKSVGQ